MSTPAGRGPIVVLAFGAGLLAVASPAMPAGVNADYRELVARYARGERAIAIGGLARFSDSELGRIAQTVEAAALAAERVKDREQGKEPPEAPIPLRAAVMLHLGLDQAERPPAAGTEQPRLCPGPQAAIAARYARILAWHEETKDFARRFFVALARSTGSSPPGPSRRSTRCTPPSHSRKRGADR